jgi:hypothetical protein
MGVLLFLATYLAQRVLTDIALPRAGMYERVLLNIAQELVRALQDRQSLPQTPHMRPQRTPLQASVRAELFPSNQA